LQVQNKYIQRRSKHQQT